MKSEVTIDTLFKGYVNYKDAEYKRIWDSGIVVVDANVLLNFYRWSDDARKEMVNALKSCKDKLWIPYHVAKEYFKNRDSVIEKANNKYKDIEDDMYNFFNQAKEKVNGYKNSQLKCKKVIIDTIEDCGKRIKKILDNEKMSKTSNNNDTNIEKIILSLFNKTIGNDFSKEDFAEIKREGIRRKDNNIPPGYKDNKKDENGDYYIFYSMMEKAKEAGNDVIFITDDTKEDWFNICEGERRGGRYELLNEFYATTGRLLLIYTSDGFIKSYSKNKLNKEADENVIKELKEMQRRNRKEYLSVRERGLETLVFDLRDYRNYLAHSDSAFDKEEILSQLSDIILRYDVPSQYAQGLHYYQMRLKKAEAINGSFNIKAIRTIEDIIDFITKKRTMNRYANLEVIQIKENYEDLLYLLSKVNEEDSLGVCEKVQYNLERHLNYGKMVYDHAKFENLLLKRKMLKDILNGKENYGVKQKIYSIIQECMSIIVENEYMEV